MTFSNGEANVKGLRVLAIEERIVEATRLPAKGAKYPNIQNQRIPGVPERNLRDP